MTTTDDVTSYKAGEERRTATARTYGLKTYEATRAKADGTLEPVGVVEAVVSVFGNVDHHKDRILPGAFEASLARWRASGDPIPYIFHHQWGDLDAHAGVVVEAEEIAPGDPRLNAAGVSPELAEGGGLWVKAELDIEEDFAGRLFKRLKRRSIREHSFAYDILKARPKDGVLELLELDVIEVGATLKGANPATALLTAKAAAAGDLDLDELDGYGADWLAQVTEDLKALGADEVADRLDASAKAVAHRGLVSFAGSIETTRDAVLAAAKAWAIYEEELDLYMLHLEATLPEDGKAYVIAERWEDPIGAGPLYELAYELDDDGAASITEATELEVELVVTPAGDPKAIKERQLASLLRSPNGKDVARTIVDDVTSGDGKASPSGEAEDLSGEDGDTTTTVTEAQAQASLAEAQRIGLDLT